MKTVREQITAFLLDISRDFDKGLTISDLRPARHLREVGFDDLDIYEIKMRVEDHFHVEVSDDSLPRNATIGQLIDFLAAFVAPVHAGAA